MNTENNLIATRYCLDKETKKSYSEMFRESKAWRCGLIDPDGLLKLHKSPSFEFKNNDCNLPVEGNMFYQREEDLKNNHESTFSNTISFVEWFEVSLLDRLSKNKNFYNFWMFSIAKSFRDEYWKIYNKESASDEEINEVHNIANKAADNFLKQLIG